MPLIVSVLIFAGCAFADDKEFCRIALESAEVQLHGFRDEYVDPARIPRSWQRGKARLVDSSDWTSGFVAGSFWTIFEFTQDLAWRASAEEWTAALQSQMQNTTTHDVGFMMYNSFGTGLRVTGDSEYEQVLLQSAESLLTRFDATVGAIRSWDFGSWNFPVIIDNMMNLELLYVATELSGNEKFANAATRHALTTFENHFRPDYSSYHVVDYDTERGVVISKQTHQGVADGSAWSRGQAWGLYGFTMAYRFTRDERFLGLAMNIAGFYLGHPHLPEDGIPYFDFDVPNYPDIANTRDSSAAAIAASALLELAGHVSGPEKTRYREAALGMLYSLASTDYSAKPGSNGHFLLMHATGRWQAHDEVDVAINYADYYYLEALLRCTRLND